MEFFTGEAPKQCGETTAIFKIAIGSLPRLTLFLYQRTPRGASGKGPVKKSQIVNKFNTIFGIFRLVWCRAQDVKNSKKKPKSRVR